MIGGTDLPGPDLDGVSQRADEAGFLCVRDAELSEAMEPFLSHGRAVLPLRSEVNVRDHTGQGPLLSHRTQHQVFKCVGEILCVSVCVTSA